MVEQRLQQLAALFAQKQAQELAPLSQCYGEDRLALQIRLVGDDDVDYDDDGDDGDGDDDGGDDDDYDDDDGG